MARRPAKVSARLSVSARDTGTSELRGPSLSVESATVDHPHHYSNGGIETIDVIEAWGLGFHLGNALKYISRCGRKPGVDPLEDLQKARWYIEREIERRRRTP
jgi:hypothetical protein